MTVSQEKVLKDTSDKLQHVEEDLQSTQQQLISKNEQVCHQFIDTEDTGFHSL